jgi:CRISPR-associated protein Cas2
MVHLIVYDIEDDAVRSKISKTLEDYGQRVQESVFECKINSCELEELIAILGEKLEGKGNIRVYPVCLECYTKAFGLGKVKEIPGSRGYEII